MFNGSQVQIPSATAVFAGMIGVTFFGVFFTPVFFSVIMKIFVGEPKTKQNAVGHPIRRESVDSR
jgi:hypothetical protein